MTQKRKLDDKDGKLSNQSTSSAESEQADKKKRPNEEKNDFSVDTVRCRICLDVVSCSIMRSMPCAHTFHENCLFQWLEMSDVCPLCKWPTRRQIRQNNEYGSNGNEYRPENDESNSDESSDESTLAELSDESQPFGSNGESQPSGSSGESRPYRSSGYHSHFSVLDLYELYDWSDDYESDGSEDGYDV